MLNSIAFERYTAEGITTPMSILLPSRLRPVEFAEISSKPLRTITDSRNLIARAVYTTTDIDTISRRLTQLTVEFIRTGASSRWFVAVTKV